MVPHKYSSPETSHLWRALSPLWKRNKIGGTYAGLQRPQGSVLYKGVEGKLYMVNMRDQLNHSQIAHRPELLSETCSVVRIIYVVREVRQ